MPSKLSTEEIQNQLSMLNHQRTSHWEIVDGKLHKQFVFKDFIEAFGFMSKAAIVAQTMNHHPEWSNVYKTVTIDLMTHDAGGITKLDFELATQMEAVA